MIDFHATMSTLASVRPVFHSEADFQHALAWRLHEDHPELSIRLEYRPPQLTQHGYIDVWASAAGETVAMELKYKTRAMKVTLDGETFDLLNQSAQDIARYDTLKDIQRLEQVVAATPHSAGFVLFLTNDSSYWRESMRADSVDVLFRMHEGRTLTGPLAWGPGASAGTRRGREAALLLSGIYEVNWRDYSQTGSARYSQFRYVLIIDQRGRGREEGIEAVLNRAVGDRDGQMGFAPPREIAHRQQTRLARLTRRAHFPFLKTIDDFNFTYQSSSSAPSASLGRTAISSRCSRRCALQTAASRECAARLAAAR